MRVYQAALSLCAGLLLGCPPRPPINNNGIGGGVVDVTGGGGSGAIGGGGGGGGGGTSLPPEPTAPVSVPKAECNADTAGRPCDVTRGDDGSSPTPLPCQRANTGRCDQGGQPFCMFEWKDNGEPCNNGRGVCENRRCKCTAPQSCGYDCTFTCP